MTTIMTAVVDPKVSRNTEKTDETHDFTSEILEKTSHLRKNFEIPVAKALAAGLALGTLAPLGAGHEWKPPTDLVLPGAETG